MNNSESLPAYLGIAKFTMGYSPCSTKRSCLNSPTSSFRVYVSDSISKLTSSMRLHSSSGIWSRRLGCVFRLAKSIRAGEFSASSMIVDAKFAVRLCWRSANAADAPPGVGFTGLSFEGIALPARPSESNLLTKAVRARRSSSSFCLSCIWV